MIEFFRRDPSTATENDSAVSSGGDVGSLRTDNRKQRILDTLLVFFCFAFLYGLLDKLTWGYWFSSFLVNLQVNVEGKMAALLGVYPFHYYFKTLYSSFGGLIIAVAVLSLVAWRRAATLLISALAFVLIHSLIAHKELRFILPTLPLFFALAAVGLTRLRDYGARRLAYGATAVLLFAALVSCLQWRQLTFGELGQDRLCPQDGSAYNCFAEINRLLLVASQHEDLCGLKLEDIPATLSGGLSYLHRCVPLYDKDGPARENGHYNYTITYNPRGGEQLIASAGPYYLLKLPNKDCIPDPSFKWEANRL